MCIESILVAFLARAFFDMPYAVCFSLAFVVAAVSPSVTVPLLINFQNMGYGVVKSVPQMLICSGTYEGIVAIIAFRITSNIAYS
mmetsp:Transcript_8502/g.7858  ORF Transcript_8502/g.7858 Transcript_8502/m.7858 type:complete len:85 (+) Transcript_8502:429-683(+)